MKPKHFWQSQQILYTQGNQPIRAKIRPETHQSETPAGSRPVASPVGWRKRRWWTAGRGAPPGRRSCTRRCSDAPHWPPSACRRPPPTACLTQADILFLVIQLVLAAINHWKSNPTNSRLSRFWNEIDFSVERLELTEVIVINVKVFIRHLKEKQKQREMLFNLYALIIMIITFMLGCLPDSRSENFFSSWKIFVWNQVW